MTVGNKRRQLKTTKLIGQYSTQRHLKYQNLAIFDTHNNISL